MDYLTLVIYVSKNKEEYRFCFALFRLVNLQMNFVQVLKHQEIQLFGLKVPQVPARQQVVLILPLCLKHTPRCLQSLFRFLWTRFVILFQNSSFFAHFMCFEVSALVPAGASNGKKKGSDGNSASDDDTNLMDSEGNDVKESKCNNSTELGALNDALHDLLDGIEEDFYAVVDWAYRIDPLRCISMHGITERYLSAQKADAAGFVRELLKDLQTKISTQFSRVSVV
ncbi:hypothetical protein BHE74_00028667 [Ensete ventricosum]|nr:hypothetical protein BHE74_00028667 [Ensete ventricosum]